MSMLVLTSLAAMAAEEDLTPSRLNSLINYSLSLLIVLRWPPWANTHTRLTALFPGLPGWAGTRKVKPIWILLEQETVSGSGISWAICYASTPPLSFLQAGCPSCRPTNSVKALKAHGLILVYNWHFAPFILSSSCSCFSSFVLECCHN